MSKHKHRNRDRYNRMNMNQNNNNNYGPINNNPFGINPQQLLNMLGGSFNMNGLGNILSSMNMDGFDLNSMANQMGLDNNFSGINNGHSSDNKENLDFSTSNTTADSNVSKEVNIENDSEKEEKVEQISFDDLNYKKHNKVSDEDIQLLISLKKIVDPKRVDFLNKIIDMCEKGLL